jgi:transcriptional regulator with XRE-family HTH domain
MRRVSGGKAPGWTITAMASRERPVDRGTRRAAEARFELGREARRARTDRGLSQVIVGRAVGMSPSEVSRIERGLIVEVSVLDLSRILAAVGLDLSAKAYPGGQPVRDAAHVALLGRLRRHLHHSLRWRTEVALPRAGDQRAWDAMIEGPGWSYGVEAETAPTDAQALARRIALKVRDSEVDGVILVIPGSRRAHAFLRDAADHLGPAFPAAGPRALELLAAGVDPGGSAIVIV